MENTSCLPSGDHFALHSDRGEEVSRVETFRSRSTTHKSLVLRRGSMMAVTTRCPSAEIAASS